MGRAISVGVLKSWQHEVADLLGGQVNQTIGDVVNSGVFYFSLVIIQKESESLDEVVISDLLSK